MGTVFNILYTGIAFGFLVGFIVHMIAYSVRTVLRVFDGNVD